MTPSQDEATENAENGEEQDHVVSVTFAPGQSSKLIASIESTFIATGKALPREGFNEMSRPASILPLRCFIVATIRCCLVFRGYDVCREAEH